MLDVLQSPHADLVLVHAVAEGLEFADLKVWSTSMIDETGVVATHALKRESGSFGQRFVAAYRINYLVHVIRKCIKVFLTGVFAFDPIIECATTHQYISQSE